MAGRGEDLQRRINVVLPASARLPGDWIDAARRQVSVLRDQSLRKAAADAAEPGAVAFAHRTLEVRRLHQLLGLGDDLLGGAR